MAKPEIEIVHHKRASTSSGSINNDEPFSTEIYFSGKITFWHQFWALFMKDLSLQIKSYVTNLCQLLVPVIFICFAGIIQIVLNHFLHKNNAVMPGSDALPIPYDIGRPINCIKGNYSDPSVCYDQPFNFLTSLDLEEWLPILNEVPFPLPDLDNINNLSNNSTFNVTFGDVIEFLMNNATVPNQLVLYDLPYYYVGKDPSVPLEINETFQSFLIPTPFQFNFSLNFTINPHYKHRYYDENLQDNGLYLEVPFFKNIKNNSIPDLQAHLVEVVKTYNKWAGTSAAGSDQYDRNYVVSPQSQDQYKNVLNNIKNLNFSEIKPQGGIFINKLTLEEEKDTMHLMYTIIDNELSIYTVRDLSFLQEIGASSSGETFDLQRRNSLINMLHNGILKHYLNNEENSTVDYSKETLIATYIMPLFSQPIKLTIDVTNLLGGILYPFAASFLFPVFISALVKDKFERHLIMMEQNGLSRITYWVITYIFNYLIYIIIAVVIALCSLIWKVRLFTQTSPLLNFIIFWVWGHSQVVLGFFFANFFNRPRTATIVGYILVIAGVMVAMLLELLQVFPEDKTPFPVYMFYPPFAFYRLLFYLINACGDYQCYTTDILSAGDGLNLVTTALLYLSGSTIVLLFVSLYLSYVLPTEYGVRKNPFFPIIAMYHGIIWLLQKAGLKEKKRQPKEMTPPTTRTAKKRERLPSTTSTTSSRHSIISGGGAAATTRGGEGEQDELIIDDDVLQEESLVDNEFSILDAPVIISRLRKEYSGSGGKPSHVAVETFSLIVNRDECFGLLGPNGAGKTTLISVLTGLYEPSSGTARIANYDLATEISEIHRHLGVCPQFDIQYPELTAEEHLLFYARLKGVKFGKAKAVVDNALKQVNLYEARKRKSQALSGGMRRRLSVAMACIGNPDILILDEPTTGLDPASRRQVWEVIERVKEGRSVILTTHAMEEADHLCTRIGIMNYGRLRCLGSQTRLKAKFGEGYQLKFHCVPGRVRGVERYVQANIPKARHMETYADSCTYQMIKEDVIVSELFELFDTVRNEIGIVDWGIKMTTLEDVFLNIVKAHTDTRYQLDTTGHCPSWLPCTSCIQTGHS